MAGEGGQHPAGARSQTRTDPSSLPLTARVPSGVTAIENANRSDWGRLRPREVARSHTRTDPSLLPLTARLPSGVTATESTWRVCPVSVACTRPVARSQTRTDPSSPPLTARVPSGVTATAQTQPLWPVSVACSRRAPGPRPAPTRRRRR